jgi:hypothetical protein
MVTRLTVMRGTTNRSATETFERTTMMRKIMKWTTKVLLGLFVVAALYIGIVVFPSPLFAHTERFGAYRVYSDDPIPADFGKVIDDLDRRIKAMEHDPPDASQRIYLCGPKKFSFFASLLRKDSRSLAIGLTIANETFVFTDRVRLFAERNRGVLRHTRFEGNLAEVVAHEVAHFNSVHALGFRPHLRQPLWKSEGWAEYQANLAAIRADPDYDLGRRIGQLLDDNYWGAEYGLARRLWEYQLMVEFLGEIKGHRLVDIVGDDVTESSTREQMLAWYRSQNLQKFTDD